MSHDDGEKKGLQYCLGNERRQTTPPIQREVFVFGSNLSGRHGKGAALYAAKHYGAEYGVGEGLTGDAYAIPTKGARLERLPFSAIEISIQRFCDFARSMPSIRFLVTPVGTGLAGHSKTSVWNAFHKARMPENCVLTASWITHQQHRSE